MVAIGALVSVSLTGLEALVVQFHQLSESSDCLMVAIGALVSVSLTGSEAPGVQFHQPQESSDCLTAPMVKPASHAFYSYGKMVQNNKRREWPGHTVPR